MPRTAKDNLSPLVGIIMGSSSDSEHLDPARKVLKEFGVPFEYKVVSAHRTPDHMFRYAEEAAGRGIEVIIAGAGGSAHLPGMVASKTVLPVIGVPVKSRALSGLDSLLSIVQMPAGVPVATVAIDGAVNAALLAIRILSGKHPDLAEKLEAYRAKTESQVLATKV
ncbi:MAG TPA: 5-(carboxyamino)imidazole ribonucleotide mutase [Bacteroidota bacterium]